MENIILELGLICEVLASNGVVQLEILLSVILVGIFLYVSYIGLQYKKIQDIFCVHNPTQITNKREYIKNCLEAPLLSSNGIAMWRVYFSIPLAILVILFYQKEVVSSAILLFYVFLFASDMLDGAVARKLNNITELGKILDPFADKFLDLIILIIVCCYADNWIFVMLAIIIAGIDIFGQYIRGQTSNPAANKIGKMKTVFKVISIYLISLNRFDIYLHNIGFVFLCISFVLAFLSLFIKLNNIDNAS